MDDETGATALRSSLLGQGAQAERGAPALMWPRAKECMVGRGRIELPTPGSSDHITAIAIPRH